MTSEGKKFRILVVDDDHQSILILKQIFRKFPYDVITAHNGQMAMQIASRELPDLILLDILMPDLSGYEVCRNLRQAAPTRNIPVIFITALNRQEEIVMGFQAGAVDYIVKPYQKEELRVRVENHLRLKASGDVIARQNLLLQQEIQQRKQTEEKFRALSQAAFEAIFFVRGDKIVECNDAALQLFGFGSSQDLGPVNRLVPQPEAQKLLRVLEIKDQGPWELQFARQDQTSFYGLLKQQEFVYRGQKIVVLAISDITRLKELEQQVRKAIIETEEKERKRFAMDLHDGLGALLSTLKIYVTLLEKPGKSQEDRDFLLGELKTNINESVATARRIANNLMPGTLSDYGLLPALESFCQKIQRSGTISINISYPKDFPRLEKNTEVNLYRVFTELVNNTLKHAGASRIDMEFNLNNGLLSTVYLDNGKGFDMQKMQNGNPGSHGLKNISTRVQLLHGEMKVKAAGNGGVMFKFEIPV